MFDTNCLTYYGEAHLTRLGCVTVAGLIGELDAFVGQYRVDAVRNDCRQLHKELPRRTPSARSKYVRRLDVAHVTGPRH